MWQDRKEFTKMLEDGCLKCKAPDTCETLATVNGIDNVLVVLCDACGHVETAVQ